MRKIQLITLDTYEYSNSTRIVTSHFSCPMSLDEFDINIIDLSSSYIWHSQQTTRTVDVMNDFIINNIRWHIQYVNCFWNFDNYLQLHLY